MEKNNYSNKIANIFEKFLIDDDWHYSFDKERGCFEFGLKVRSKLQRIRYRIDIHEDEAVVYGFCPIGADPEEKEMMAQMAEFICRANYGLKNGNFDFDFRDGEIRYKVFVDCDGVLPSTEVVQDSIYCTAAMIDRYADGITSIIFSGASAKEAITMCEGASDDGLRGLLAELGIDTDSGEVAELLSRLEEELESISEEEDEADETETSETEANETEADETEAGETAAPEEAEEVHVDLFGMKKKAEAE